MASREVELLGALPGRLSNLLAYFSRSKKTRGTPMNIADVAFPITIETLCDRGLRHRVAAVLGYHSSEPFAVTLTFPNQEDGEVVWTFSRDLLHLGSTGEAGEGDVKVAPATGLIGEAEVKIEISSPEGRMELRAKASAIAGFLASSFVAVPQDNESDYFNADLLISQLLNS